MSICIVAKAFTKAGTTKNFMLQLRQVRAISLDEPIVVATPLSNRVVPWSNSRTQVLNCIFDCPVIGLFRSELLASPLKEGTLVRPQDKDGHEVQ